MEIFDAVILAAGRLSARVAERAGVEIKALLKVGDTTPLRAIVAAMRAAPSIGRIIVVAPSALRESPQGVKVDVWVDELASGDENAVAGLQAAHTRRAVLSASDVPFVEASHVTDFLARVPADADFAYPVYERAEFLSVFPGGRTSFARVGETQWTGGSVCLVNVELALRNAALLRRCFTARKSQLGMASLLGVRVMLRYASGRLKVTDIERRLSGLTRGKAVAVRGAHPALAMDCDSLIDVEYVRARQAMRSGV